MCLNHFITTSCKLWTAHGMTTRPPWLWLGISSCTWTEFTWRRTTSKTSTISAWPRSEIRWSDTRIFALTFGIRCWVSFLLRIWNKLPPILGKDSNKEVVPHFVVLILSDLSEEGSFGVGNLQIFAQIVTEMFFRFINLNRDWGIRFKSPDYSSQKAKRLTKQN